MSLRTRTDYYALLDRYEARAFMRDCIQFAVDRESTGQQAESDRYGRDDQGADRGKATGRHGWRAPEERHSFFIVDSGTDVIRSDVMRGVLDQAKAFVRPGQPVAISFGRGDRVSRDDADFWNFLNEAAKAGVIIYLAKEDIACGLDEGWRGQVRPVIVEACRYPEKLSDNVRGSYAQKIERNGAAVGGLAWGFEFDRKNGRFRPQHAFDCPNRPRYDTDGRPLNGADPWNLECPTEATHPPIKGSCEEEGPHMCDAVNGAERLFCPIRGRLLICELYRTGKYTERTLVLHMNGLGWRYCRKRRFEPDEQPVFGLITRDLVRECLTNPLVVGDYQRGRGSRSPQPLEVGYIRPLYERAKWEEIQNVIKPGNTPDDNPARFKHVHLFAKLARCADCDRQLRANCQHPNDAQPHYVLGHPFNEGCCEGKVRQPQFSEAQLFRALLDEARNVVVTPERRVLAERYAELTGAIVLERHRKPETIREEMLACNEIYKATRYRHIGGYDAYQVEQRRLADELKAAEAAGLREITRRQVDTLGSLVGEMRRGYELSRDLRLTREERDLAREKLSDLLHEVFEAVLVGEVTGDGRKTWKTRLMGLRIKPKYQAFWLMCHLTVNSSTTGGSIQPDSPVVEKTRGAAEVRLWLEEQRMAA